MSFYRIPELNSILKLNLEVTLFLKSGGIDCRDITTRIQLFVPHIEFNSSGQSIYMDNYLTQNRVGSFRITSRISKPRHVFAFIINDANIFSLKQQIHLCITHLV